MNPAAFNPNNLLKVAIVIFSVLMVVAGVAVAAGVHLGPAPAKQAAVVYVHDTPTPTASPTADQTSHGGYAVPAPGPTVAPRNYVRPNSAPPAPVIAPPPPTFTYTVPPPPTGQYAAAQVWRTYTLVANWNSFSSAWGNAAPPSSVCQSSLNGYSQTLCFATISYAANQAHAAAYPSVPRPSCAQGTATYYNAMAAVADELSLMATGHMDPYAFWGTIYTKISAALTALNAVTINGCPQ